MSGHSLLVLDGLFDDLEVEASVARSRGWSVQRWDGSDQGLRDAEVALHVRTRVDRALLAKMPSCRVVARFGTGLDTVDHAAAAERGIRVVGVRDYCIPELASHTLGLAFALDRRADGVRSGMLGADDSWQDIAARVPIPGRTTATVVGLGSVGTAIARALLAIGISVRVVTEHGAEHARRLGATPVTLPEGLMAGRLHLPACGAHTGDRRDDRRRAPCLDVAWHDPDQHGEDWIARRGGDRRRPRRPVTSAVSASTQNSGRTVRSADSSATRAS